ncbi:MAG: FHA domain-containing protein, partial [Pseudomonadota bacterium]
RNVSRLPQGETVSLDLGKRRRFDLKLARHAVSLVGGSRWLLKDATGATFMLRPGKNFVGRSQQNDISLPSTHRQISRRHLLVEPTSATTVRVTDLSSGGTFVTA